MPGTSFKDGEIGTPRTQQDEEREKLTKKKVKCNFKEKKVSEVAS